MPRATLHLPLFSGHIRNSCLPVANPFTSSSSSSPSISSTSSVALYTVGYYRSLYFQRGPTASRWKTETGREGGGTGCSPYMLLCVTRFRRIYTVYSYKGKLMLWSIERAGREEGKRGVVFLSSPLYTLDTRYTAKAFIPCPCVTAAINSIFHSGTLAPTPSLGLLLLLLLLSSLFPPPV